MDTERESEGVNKENSKGMKIGPEARQKTSLL